MGGKKRKIQIEKIEEKTIKSVAFTKRRNGLFGKAAQLCDLSPSTQIAILVTPISTNSHASFYTLGHPSADEVVYSLLHNQSSSILPKNQFENTNSELGFWWEDKSFDVSEDVDELKEAVDAVSTMLNKVKLQLDEAVTQDKKLLGMSNNDSNQNPKSKGETSASASTLLPNEEIRKIDDLLADFDIDLFQLFT